MTDIVTIRTARKEHGCCHYLCRAPILPGESYEVHSTPPWSDGNDSPHWMRARVHRSQPGGGFGSGCDEAAAYRENERRQLAAADLIVFAAGLLAGGGGRPWLRSPTTRPWSASLSARSIAGRLESFRIIPGSDCIQVWIRRRSGTRVLVSGRFKLARTPR